MIKPSLSPEADPEVRDAQRAVLLHVFESILRLGHPFIPFITEEIWQLLPGGTGRPDAPRESILAQAFPEADSAKLDIDVDVREGIAALDLELRGAGNLLGGEQSGHIEAVGLDLYIKLLEQTILELKGHKGVERTRAVLNLHQDLRIPGDYAPDVHQRMSLYKRVSQAQTGSELDALRAEVRDRYGPFPPSVEGLFAYASLRLQAEALGVATVDARSVLRQIVADVRAWHRQHPDGYDHAAAEHERLDNHHNRRLRYDLGHRAILQSDRRSGE